MPVLIDPVSAAERTRWRAAVLDLRSDVRRVFAPLLHAGTPGGLAATYAVRSDPHLDAGLRADLARVLIERTRRADAPAAFWLTRPGMLDLHDLDAQWLAAVVRACREAGVDDTFVVVTREGWRDPRSGAGCTWKRLRPRAAAPRSDG